MYLKIGQFDENENEKKNVDFLHWTKPSEFDGKNSKMKKVEKVEKLKN